ncbi:MAG: toprim domain-containing protein [Alistipes indistinctus]
MLNSVSNLSKAMSAIASHATILTYLDNDEAGRRTMAEIRRQAEGCTVIDRSELYKEYNDLNDYWKVHARNVGMGIKR